MSDGGVMEMSDKARQNVRLRDNLELAKADLEAANRDLATANATIAELRGANTRGSSKPLLDLRGGRT